MCGEKRLDHGIVLLAKEAAGRIDERAARPDQSSDAFENPALPSSQLLDVSRSKAPADFRMGSKRSGTRAWRVDERGVERGGGKRRSGGVGDGEIHTITRELADSAKAPLVDIDRDEAGFHRDQVGELARLSAG